MKLFTKDIDKKLFAQFKYGSDLSQQKVVAKIFNPYGRGTWYLLNSDPADPDYIWAIVNLFEVEMGSISRNEIETIKVPPFRLPLERDLHFKEINAKELWDGLMEGKHYAHGGYMADGGKTKSSTDKLIEYLKNNGELNQGKDSIAKDGTKYRYDRYNTKGESANNWVVSLFEKAAQENGNRYATQFSYKNIYSIFYDRPKYNNVVNGKISMTELVELGEMAHGGMMAKGARIFGGNSGYNGYSMSVRAQQAYDEGKLPLSKLPTWANRLVEAGLVTTDEWHHTSSYGNETPFYNISQFDVLSDEEKKELGIDDWGNYESFDEVPKNVVKLIDAKSKQLIKEKNNIKLVRSEYVKNALKEINDFKSKFKRFTRVTKAPDFGKVELSEMNGKYGWFNSSGKSYNMTEYYSGIDYETEDNYEKARQLKNDLDIAQNEPIYYIKLSKIGFDRSEINRLKVIGLITSEIMPESFYQSVEKNKDLIKSQINELKNLPSLSEGFKPYFKGTMDDFLTDEEKQARREYHYYISEQGENFGDSYERRVAHEVNDDKYYEIAKPRYKKAEKEYFESDEVKEKEKEFNDKKQQAQSIIDNLLSIVDVSENEMAKGGYMADGGTFKEAVKSIEKKLVNKKVPKKYVSKYGKRYNRKEAHEAASNIKGAIVKRYENKTASKYKK